MSDIVKRLYASGNVFYEYYADNGALLREAADEIERLNTEVDRLQNSLSEYKSILRFLSALDLEWFTEHDELLLETIVKNARAALAETEPKA